MAYGRNYYPDQQVFLGALNGTPSEIKGVQAFDGSWNVPYEQMNAGGYEFVGTEIQGELVGDVSVSRYIITGTDPITGLINEPVSGFLVYGTQESYDKVFNFKRGYITSYESSCSLGDIATCDFGLTAYGGIGKIGTGSRSYTPIEAQGVRASDITLTTEFGSTNAIQSYNLSLAFERSPVPKVGQMFEPIDFTTALPIVATLGLEVLVNDMELENVKDVVCSGFAQDILIEMNKCGELAIRSFTLNDSKLVDSSIKADIGSNMTISLTYEAYYNSITGAISKIMS